MTFSTPQFTEVPLRTSLPLFSSSSSSSSSSTRTPPFRAFSISLSSSSYSTRTNKNPRRSNNRPDANFHKKWSSSRHRPFDDNSRPKLAQSNDRDKHRNLTGDKTRNAAERIVLRIRDLGLGSDDEDDDEEEEEEEAEIDGQDFLPVLGEERLVDLLERKWVRTDTAVYSNGEGRGEEEELVLPWEREDRGRELEGEGRERKRTVRPPTLAELTLEDEELKRLRRMGMYMREKINVPKAGLTKEVLEKIYYKWRKEELVRLKFHEVLARDMKTAHKIVERRTGGLIIWRAGSIMVVYRGSNYQGPPMRSQTADSGDSLSSLDVSSTDTAVLGSGSVTTNFSEKIEPTIQRVVHIENMTEEEAEYNNLLDGLGPRFEEWWGTGVLPVDADLLPQKVPGYKTPFRLLPTGMRPRLTNAEMTNLRNVAKLLPCHFALGRNRNHQGLASAILKLWEKSLVVKIAVKRGIQNTNNKLMAEELKALTGGILLLRNKYYIVIYRGKDFLPTSVAAALAERQELTKQIQDVEEKVRSREVDAAPICDEGKTLAGTLAEFYEAQARWGREISTEEHEQMIEEAAKAKKTRLIKQIEHKFAIAQAKKLRAERLLAKIEASMVPAEPDYDPETITDEERIMFRRVGLRMKAYLPLGIRGVFDGVIENMHLHWKHRELVKLISKQKTRAFVEDTARLLEYESGGILVAIERVPKGFALIYYRGKNYHRPINIRPRNLLTKAKALKRSVAMQRHEALSQHISELEKTIEQLKQEIGLSHGDENIWNKDEDDHLNRVSSPIQSEDEALWIQSIGKDEEQHGVIDDDNDDDDDEVEDNYEIGDWETDEDEDEFEFEFSNHQEF